MSPFRWLRRTFTGKEPVVPSEGGTMGATSPTPAPKKPTRILNSRPSPWGQIIHPAPGELYEVTEELVVSYVVEERYETHGGLMDLPVGERIRVWRGLFSNPFDQLPKSIPCDHVVTDPKRTSRIRETMGLPPDRSNYRFEIEIESFVQGHFQHIPEAD